MTFIHNANILHYSITLLISSLSQPEDSMGLTKVHSAQVAATGWFKTFHSNTFL